MLSSFREKEIKDRSLIYLIAVTAFYTLASSATGVFLPNYFLNAGLSVNQVISLFAAMFLVLGIVPVFTLKFIPKLFEKLLIAGLLLGMLFFFLLGFVRNPLVLGLVLGLSYAMFWPAFNLLLFRFTSIKKRGLVATLLYFAVPTVASVIGPFLGGVFINFLSFNLLFLLAIALLFLAFVFSLRIKYAPAEGGLNIPRSWLLLLFAFIILTSGFGDVTWIAYPLFLHKLAGGFLEMGILVSVLSLIFAVVSLIAGKTSRVEKHRISFAAFAMLMSSIWVISLSFVQNIPQLIGIWMFEGLYGAFSPLLFALYGDFFKRKQHATLVVLWEVFLMFGRLANLVPVGIFVNSFDFGGYFLVVGVISISCAALLVILKILYSEGKIRVDIAQR
jgi:MFS family permease